MFEGPTSLITILRLLGEGILPNLAGSGAPSGGSQVPAASVEAGQRGVENGPVALSAPAESPPASAEPPPPPRIVPVATPGGAATSGRPQGSETDSLPPSVQDLLARLQTPGSQPPASAQPTQQASPMSELGSNPLARFGFAMAASRNPSLFGQIGEAGLAMQQGNRENRQDSNREAEVDVMRDYRRAQTELARAEQEWQRDPNNPRAIALLAEARYRDAAAQRAAREPTGGGSSGGPFVQIQNPETGEIGFFQPRSGNLVRAPEGFGRPGENAREEAARQRDMLAFGTLNRNNPMYLTDGNALMRDAQAYAEAQAQRRRTSAPRAATTDSPPRAAGAPDRVIDLTPRSR